MSGVSGIARRCGVRTTHYVNIARMPKLTVEDFETVDVPDGKRLVRAIEEDAGVDILHACGGNARCTTCRVQFLSGEPTRMTKAEKLKIEERGLQGGPRSGPPSQHWLVESRSDST